MWSKIEIKCSEDSFALECFSIWEYLLRSYELYSRAKFAAELFQG